MWFSLSGQTAYFLWSIVFGAAAAVLYDLVRAARIFLKAGKLCLLLSDILFFALCGALTVLFALPFNKGGVRAFIVFGETVGFLVYRFTVGQLTGRFYSILSKEIKRLMKKICDLLKLFFDFLLKISSRMVYNIDVLIDRFSRKLSAKRKERKKRKKNSRKVRNDRPGRKPKGGARYGGHKTEQRNGYEKESQKRNQKEKRKRRRRRRDRRDCR